MNPQQPLFSPPAPPRAEGLWPDLGRWMVGEGPIPVEIVAAQVARTHRQRVNAAAGGGR